MMGSGPRVHVGTRSKGQVGPAGSRGRGMVGKALWVAGRGWARLWWGWGGDFPHGIWGPLQ